MDADAYDDYTRRLVRWAERRSDVLGVVALGSTASTDHRPDRYSDHDLFVVTVDGAAQALRDDVGWLPDAHRIALCHIETRHGRGVVYDDGHLVEIAVFEPGELHVCRVNTYRVLHDTGDVAAWIAALASTTTAAQAAADPDGTERFAAFVQQMIVGINRDARGEHLSASARLRGQALELLASLVRDLVPAAPDAAIDNLDPHRRFELAHPEIGRRLVTRSTARSTPWPASSSRCSRSTSSRVYGSTRRGRSPPSTACSATRRRRARTVPRRTRRVRIRPPRSTVA